MSGEPTFEPPVNPSFPIRDKRQPRVYSVPFGDGYTERVAAGINTNGSQLQLTWENITTSQKTAIKNFLDARAGHAAFLYQPPGFDDELKWICPDHEVTFTDADAWTVTASLTQVFDP